MARSEILVRAAAAMALIGTGLVAACNAISGVGDLQFNGTGGTGVVVAHCTSPSDCPEPEDDCATRTCTAGICGVATVPDGTVAATQVPGDCKVLRCISGEAVAQDDDSDVPVTTNDCDVDACAAGVPSNAPRDAGTPCNTDGGHFCDGGGACVECNADADCPGTIDDCQRPACDQHKCGTAFTVAMTETSANPAQIPGDCMRRVCDGTGAVIEVPDLSDPEDDHNDCTQDTCDAADAGAPTAHTNLDDGTKCGAGMTLACVSGVCSGCTQSEQCSPQSCDGTSLVLHQVCNAQGKCVSAGVTECSPYECDPAGCTTNCVDDDGCAAGNYCDTAGECKAWLPQGVACNSNHECQLGKCVDGFCCNSDCTGACVSCANAQTGANDGTCAPIKASTDPDDECADQGAASCGTDGKCDGAGACRSYANGTVCAASSCQGTTFVPANTCLDGACHDNDDVVCVGGSCSLSGCVTDCVNDDGNCQSGYYCAATTCAEKKALSVGCGSGHECLSGFCVDGVCCNLSACGTCQGCNTFGNPGYCASRWPNEVDPDSGCDGTKACDGWGGCRLASGQPCQAPSECASNSCSPYTLECN